ncbi:hypothetical protein FS837_010957 [Tulasnella sp. UAMH 9824]|nr:hypothetical protein FS837_010957 [Tulasnella sp. UAMH 9824]
MATSPTQVAFRRRRSPTHPLLVQPSASSSRKFYTSSSSLAKRFAQLKLLLFKRFGFITKRFDACVRNLTVVPTSTKLPPLDLLMRMPSLAFAQYLFYA